MRANRRFISAFIDIALGLVLVGCGALGIVDEFWSGMGTAFLFVGAIFMARMIRYRTNDEYREQVDIAQSDERNRYLAGKAWGWAGYLFVVICGFLTIVMKLWGRDDLAQAAGAGVCMLVFLYWGSYMVLKRKY